MIFIESFKLSIFWLAEILLTLTQNCDRNLISQTAPNNKKDIFISDIISVTDEDTSVSFFLSLISMETLQ